MDYINDLMRNYPLGTESVDFYTDELNNMVGGAQLIEGPINDRPNGGCVPIRPRLKAKPDDKVVKAKGYTFKSTVNIKEIMEQRKEKKPFLDI